MEINMVHLVFSFGLMIGMYIVARLAHLIISLEPGVVVTVLAILALGVAVFSCYCLVAASIEIQRALTELGAFLERWGR